MIKQLQIQKRDNDTIEQLLSIWIDCVKETHTFLTSADINTLLPEVRFGLLNIPDLHVYLDGTTIYGFIGIDKDKVEMLFVDTTMRGKGIGKELLNFAIHTKKIKYIDVNEQNTQGVGFYQHMGFTKIKRSATDSEGRPFPILHLKLAT